MLNYKKSHRDESVKHIIYDKERLKLYMYIWNPSQ